ncbi:5416_t:CDS:2 [Dentiscutata heterogama]|uniref:5416_t:CDS:1 n=1 Tax=Dentiscutata heterogama TaxID=1316150 RepID=A0ACA9K4U1_9GLOM|nr:5416_t:CDS:2 [Dentiscutata heterogama]
MTDFPEFVHRLLEPIPQYVLGCLPAIAIVGASPTDKFTRKLQWVLRCLGCPFIGIFYAVNVGGNKESRCLFWLPVNYFINGETNRRLEYRPVGLLSPVISLYYIIIGALAGISRTTGSHVCEDWPYIPLLLSWTIPALWRRISSGNLVVKDPKVEFDNIRITMVDDADDTSQKWFTVSLTAFISIALPWITVFLAYFTPPIGYFCRSKYVTTICAIWSFNSAIAFLCHWIGEKDLTMPKIFHVLFSIWGFIVAILLFVLGLFNKNPEWWVGLFGCSCDVSSAGCPVSRWGC